jgi:glutamyl-tRNA synthetase
LCALFAPLHFTAVSTVRVRFAPSPTGFLHVGVARTALFNWLFARNVGGTFILRIEDTDRERSSDAMTDAILDGMSWLGLAWDEGPFHQADGFPRHAADVQKLLAAGAAYRCFCSEAALEERRGHEGAASEAYRYDRFCLTTVSPEESDRRAAAGEPFVVRFRVPAGTTTWNDAVYGRIEFDNAEIEDFIILRTDGTPIYNLAVVSDDVHMRITHVMRGDDHISNTPKQILLYEGLGAPLPIFAHAPMILGPDGKRLSKRHGATAVGEYRRLGILPSAMVNFLALLGWSPGTNQEIFTTEELIAQFSLEGINRKSAVFDVQKLLWLNGQHINRMAADELESLVREALVAEGIDPSGRSQAWLRALIDLLKPRARNIQDIARQARPYLVSDIDYEPDAVEKHWKEPEQVAHRLARVKERFASTHTWDVATLEQDLRALADELGVGAAKLIHPLRVALTGSSVGPGIFDVAALMGRDLVLSRTDSAVHRLSDGAAEDGR